MGSACVGGEAAAPSTIIRAMTLDLPATDSPPALSVPAAFEACARLRGDLDRLACYDTAAGRPQSADRMPDEEARAVPAAPLDIARGVAGDSQGAGLMPIRAANNLSSFWELDNDRKRGTFQFIGYRPNFFLPVQVSSLINRTPTSPNPLNTPSTPLPAYRGAEAKVQLSIRTKIAQGVVLPGADLWFTYTQQSFWQLYSTRLSAPFRSTDHEPELLYVVPTPASLPMGWSWRMGAFGVVHQSNGQALPLSRSWNRLVAMAGFERGELALTARLNQRLGEPSTTNDNPDLVDWRGRWDLMAIWTPGLATSSLQWRTNFDRRGSLQLDWTFPVDSGNPGGLRWYAQVFSGYGESLLDYNVRKTSAGFGVTLFGW
jgi:phospholipase A1/A2